MKGGGGDTPGDRPATLRGSAGRGERALHALERLPLLLLALLDRLGHDGHLERRLADLAERGRTHVGVVVHQVVAGLPRLLVVVRRRHGEAVGVDGGLVEEGAGVREGTDRRRGEEQAADAQTTTGRWSRARQRGSRCSPWARPCGSARRRRRRARRSRRSCSCRSGRARPGGGRCRTGSSSRSTTPGRGCGQRPT